MADQTILQETLDNNIVDGDWLIYWKTSTGVQRRVARSSLLGATLTGAGTIATGGFTLTVPATGTAALKTGTPVAGNVAQWDDANTVEDAGFAASAVTLKTGTPVANNIAQWDSATTVEDAGFAASNVALLLGRSGGQNLSGGTAANDDLTLQGTTNATRATSYVSIQPNGGSTLIGASASVAATMTNSFPSGTEKLIIADGYIAFHYGANGDHRAGIGWNSATDALEFKTGVGSFSLNTTPMSLDRPTGKLKLTTLAGVGTRGVSATSTGVLEPDASDARMKTDVQAIEAGDALAMVDALRPVRYRWNEEHSPSRGEQVEVGLIAQEVQTHVPEVIGANADGMLSVDYPRLTALLIGAVQALTARVEALEAAAA